MSISGCALRDLDRDPGRADHPAGDEHPDRLRGAPAPRRRLADRDQDQRHTGAHQHGSRPVDPAGNADRRLRHETPRAHGGDDDQDERQPEQPVPAQVLHDRGAGEDADATADPEQCRHEPDAAGDALSRELVPDDPERQWEDAAADPLDGARDDQQRE